jgi:hypothetical protein
VMDDGWWLIHIIIGFMRRAPWCKKDTVPLPFVRFPDTGNGVPPLLRSLVAPD